MKQLKLNNSIKLAFIDDTDYSRCILWKWWVHHSATGTRILRTINARVTLANFVMDDFKHVYDHKDRDFLNNQRDNLKICNRSQNQANREKYDLKRITPTTSVYKGVSWTSNKWAARIGANGIRKYLGLFENEEEAAAAYNKAALEIYGEFACLNKILSKGKEG